MTGKSIKQALILIIFLSYAGITEAQWEAGVRGGISVPNLTAGGADKNPLNTGYSSRLGPDFGAFGEYHFNNHFSLQAGAEYCSEGGKKNGLQALAMTPELAAYFESQNMPAPTYLYATYKSEAKLNYLLIPILAKWGWDLGGASPFRFYVSAGPYVGFLVSAKQVTSGSSSIYLDAGGTQALPGGAQSFDQTTDIKDQLHTVNFGIDGHIGLSYGLGHDKMQHLFFEAGGNYGFINIQKGSANGKNNAGAAVATIGISSYLKRPGKQKG